MPDTGEQTTVAYSNMLNKLARSVKYFLRITDDVQHVWLSNDEVACETLTNEKMVTV